MSRGALKLLAILLMAGNHIAQVFLSPDTVSYHLLLTLGYATAPLMCAFLSDGFIYTHHRKTYGIRLLIFALVSELPFYLAFGRTGNMGWTLLLSYLCLVFWERKTEWACIPLILLTGWTDWSFLAPVFTLMVYGAKEDKGQEALVFLYGTFLFALICAANGEPMLHASGFFLAGILRVLCYNGEKGNVPGSLFYLFYPVHLFVFGLLAR